MTEPVPDLATRLTLGAGVPGSPAPLPLGPGEPGCCPGEGPAPLVPAPSRFPVPGSPVPGSGPDLPELSLGSRKLTWWQWLTLLVGHWTGLYARQVKRRRQKDGPPPERLREHARWVMDARWDEWLPDNCEWLRRYVLGPVEGTYQILIGIPADAVGKSVRAVFRYSVTGMPALAVIIYLLIHFHVL